MTHVDLIANQWDAGRQTLLARVIEATDTVLAEGNPVWTEHLASFASLEEVSNKYRDGTYLEASSPHEDNACAFRDTTVLPMRVTRPKETQ